jgi:hypothetical protein
VTSPMQDDGGGPVRDVEIFAPPGAWARIRSDERFVELMRLARATNALSLAYGPLIRLSVDD